MGENIERRVAIVDYGLGNLFSIEQACRQAGLTAEITAEHRILERADVIVLPGVGSFGDAMQSLRSLNLDRTLRQLIENGHRLIGICLGLQLLMETSEEFGRHEGLGIFPGRVRRLAPTMVDGRVAKVPHIGWNAISPPAGATGWADPLLSGVDGGETMYFVHSYCVEVADASLATAVTEYGGDRFCSAVRSGRVSAFQFHPERSGRAGLRIYSNLASELAVTTHRP